MNLHIKCTEVDVVQQHPILKGCINSQKGKLNGCASHWLAVTNVALALVVAGLPSALVGRWSALVSEPHGVRERESDFERLVGQNLWKLTFLSRSETLSYLG